MHRLIKITDGSEKVEILAASTNLDLILTKLVDYVVEHASNGDEYTSEDRSAIKYQERERIGDYTICVDHPSKLTDAKIVSRGGGVCAHCGSDETDPSMPEMEDGYITRMLHCETCGLDTEEIYSLSGTRD